MILYWAPSNNLFLKSLSSFLGRLKPDEGAISFVARGFQSATINVEDTTSVRIHKT
jgi:hypothetical protein